MTTGYADGWERGGEAFAIAAYRFACDATDAELATMTGHAAGWERAHRERQRACEHEGRAMKGRQLEMCTKCAAVRRAGR